MAKYNPSTTDVISETLAQYNILNFQLSLQRTSTKNRLDYTAYPCRRLSYKCMYNGLNKSRTVQAVHWVQSSNVQIHNSVVTILR